MSMKNGFVGMLCVLALSIVALGIIQFYNPPETPQDKWARETMEVLRGERDAPMYLVKYGLELPFQMEFRSLRLDGTFVFDGEDTMHRKLSPFSACELAFNSMRKLVCINYGPVKKDAKIRPIILKR